MLATDVWKPLLIPGIHTSLTQLMPDSAQVGLGMCVWVASVQPSCTHVADSAHQALRLMKCPFPFHGHSTVPDYISEVITDAAGAQQCY